MQWFDCIFCAMFKTLIRIIQSLRRQKHSKTERNYTQKSGNNSFNEDWLSLLPLLGIKESYSGNVPRVLCEEAWWMKMNLSWDSVQLTEPYILLWFSITKEQNDIFLPWSEIAQLFILWLKWVYRFFSPSMLQKIKGHINSMGYEKMALEDQNIVNLSDP